MAFLSKARANRRLMLDSVIGSQPELGPAPPDGGYGWAILFGVIIIQMTIPSILVTSGLLICHINDNTTASLDDTQWIWLPTIYCAAWSLADPWSITMTSVFNSCCMAVTGVLLVVSGLMAGSLIPSNVDIVYIGLGLLAGIGASMATVQCEYLLKKYFNSRLSMVRNISQAGQAIGEIFMPVLVGYLLTEFGLSSTLLLQAAITMQAIVGAALFRSPKYAQSTQSVTEYSLLKNEDACDNKNCENVQSTSKQHNATDVSHENPPYIRPDDTSDDEPLNFNTNNAEIPHTSDTSPSSDGGPQPLFSEVDLSRGIQNAAFFIEDSDDDIELYVQRGGYSTRTIPCSEEIKVLAYPLFYCGLFLTAITKISTLAFWILLPLLLLSRLQDFQFYKAILLLSIGGIASVFPIIVSHWLPAMSARGRKIFFITSAYVTAGGLYLLGMSYSWPLFVCATALIRIGTSGITNAMQLVFRDAMGTSEVIKTHTLLHIFTGLLIMLGMMVISSNFATSFKILAWIQVAAATLWSLQPILNRLCNIRR